MTRHMTHPMTRTLTHNMTRLLLHPLTHPLMHTLSLTHSLIHSLNHSHSLPPSPHPLTHSYALSTGDGMMPHRLPPQVHQLPLPPSQMAALMLQGAFSYHALYQFTLSCSLNPSTRNPIMHSQSILSHILTLPSAKTRRTLILSLSQPYSNPNPA